jgi:hypothetical protein
MIYYYKLCHSSITHPDYIKDLGVFTDSKLWFHNHVDYIFSWCIKLLGLVRTLTFSFSSLDCLYMLYFTLVRSKLEYALLFRILLRLLMPTNWNASSRSLQPFVIIISFPMSNTAMLML